MAAEVTTSTPYTIIVPTRGRTADFNQIAKNFADVPAGIPLIIVANTSFIGPTAGLSERPNTQILFVPGGGVARVRNVGLWIAETNIILFLDDDILPSMTAFEVIVNHLSGSDTGVVTARICSSLSEDPISTLYSTFFSVDRGDITLNFSERNGEKVSPMSAWSMGVGGAFGVNRLCLRTNPQLPIFDETLSNGRFCGGAEDVDFFLQCFQVGLIVEYCGNAVLIHQEVQNLSKLRARMVQYARADGAFYAKWRSLLGVRDVLADVVGWVRRVKLHMSRRIKGETALPLVALLREPIEKVVGAVWWRWIAL